VKKTGEKPIFPHGYVVDILVPGTRYGFDRQVIKWPKIRW